MIMEDILKLNITKTWTLVPGFGGNQHAKLQMPKDPIKHLIHFYLNERTTTGGFIPAGSATVHSPLVFLFSTSIRISILVSTKNTCH